MSNSKMMLRIGTIVISLISAMTLLPIPSNANLGGTNQFEPAVTAPKKHIWAKVDFVSPISIEEAIEVAHERKLSVAFIEHSFLIGDQTFVGFYPVTSKNKDKVRSGLLEAYKVFLQDMIESPKQPEVETVLDSNEQVAFRNMEAQFMKAKLEADTTELKIDRIIVKGKVASIEALKESSPLIQSAEAFNVEQTNVQNEIPLISAASYVDWEKWQPEWGRVQIGPSTQSGFRILDLRMMWDDVSGFSWDSTYEHDFFLNNDPRSALGPGTYLDRSEWPGGLRIPKVDYAASNLPRAYLDTRIGDASNLIAYTIGSAKASDILTNTWYYNYFRTRNGDASRDNAWLTAQRGIRLPPNDFSTWASWSVQQNNIFPNWQIQVPSTFSWRK